MSWREPMWLLLMLFPLLGLIWQHYRKHFQVTRYVDAALLPWVQVQRQGWQRWLRPTVWSGFWWLAAISLAGPQRPLDLPQSKSGIAQQDIYVLVDMSRSMHAKDVLPNRLGRARIELHEFTGLLENSRLEIIVYAGKPHLLAPLTNDIAAADFYLQQLESLKFPTLGGNAAAALAFVQNRISAREQKNAPAHIYWLTDGDAARQQDALLEQAGKLAVKNIRLNILGIGTEAGAYIPIPNGGWAQQAGVNARSQLNSGLLQRLADITAGSYAVVRNDQTDWEQIYLSQAAGTATQLPEQPQKHWQQLYQWALAPAVVLFILLIGAPRRWLPIALLAALPLHKPVHAADESMQLGEQAYRTATFDDAITHFTDAVMQAKSELQRGRALHNLGNSYFFQGEILSAVQVFEDALNYRPGHVPTEHNLGVAKKVLQRMQRQLQLQAARRSQQGEDNIGAGFGAGQQPQGSGNDQGENAGFDPGEDQGGRRTAIDGQQDPTQEWGSGNGEDLELPQLPAGEEALQSLVGVGLKRLSLRGITTMEEWRQRNQSLYEARLVLQKMHSRSELLWKRMFEIEEGFPGSLDAPRETPGLQQW